MLEPCSFRRKALAMHTAVPDNYKLRKFKKKKKKRRKLKRGLIMKDTNPKGHRLRDCSCVTFWERQNHGDDERQ